MNKMRQWSMLTAAAVVVVFVAGWFLAISPQRHHAADLHTKTATQEAANASLRSQVAQLELQKQGLPAQQRLLAKFATKIPDNPELPALIRQLTAAADQAGIDLVSMSPSTPSAVAATPGTTTTATAASSLNQISLQLNVTGSYFNLESWFAAIEKLPRAMKVTQWSLTPGSSSSQSGGSSGSAATTASHNPPGTMSATMTALVYESPQVVPAAVSPAAAPAQAK
jgi:Tfp pilus assembly protein PilO